jgi:hypothetical protein
MSAKTMSALVDNVRVFTFSDLDKYREFCDLSRTELKNAEREIDNLREYVDHLEATIAKVEDERDHYKHILLGCA